MTSETETVTSPKRLEMNTSHSKKNRHKNTEFYEKSKEKISKEYKSCHKRKIIVIMITLSKSEIKTRVDSMLILVTSEDVTSRGYEDGS